MPFIRRLLPTLAVLVIAAAPCFSQDSAWRKPYDTALELMERGAFPAARQAFAEAFELSQGGCAACLLGLAEAAGRTGDRAAAAGAARRVLAASQEPAELRKALALLRGFAERDPGDPLALEAEAAVTGRMLVELTGGRHAQDLQTLFQTLARLRDDAAIVELAQSHLAGGDLERRSLLCAVDPRSELRGPGRARSPELLSRLNVRLREAEWSGPFFLTEGMAIPEPLHRPPIAVPADLGPRSASGVVHVGTVLDTGGALIAPWLRRSPSTALAELVVDRVRSWRYEPATVDGRRVDLCLNLAVDFSSQRRHSRGRPDRYADLLAALRLAPEITSDPALLGAARDLAALLEATRDEKPAPANLAPAEHLLRQLLAQSLHPHRSAVLGGLFEALARRGDEEAIRALVERELAGAGREQRATLCAVPSETARRRPGLNDRLLDRGWPGPFLVSDPVIGPQKISAPQPRYPDEARKARIQGVVVVRAVVDEAGLPNDLRVLSGLPMGVSESAVDAISTWRFEPARLDGRTIPVCMALSVNFRLQ